MVSLTSVFVATLACIGLTHAAEQADMANLPVGAYFRPVGTGVVSGYVDATTPYRRGPCPGLNTLANHGYLPRDGKNITQAQALAAVKEYYGAADDLLAVIASLTPSTFDLNDLSAHNDPAEHDASLSRMDTYFGGDQSLIALNVTADLLLRGIDGRIDVTDVAKARAARVAWSTANNPDFSYGSTQQFIAGAESGFVLRIMGGENSEVAKTSFVTSFFVAEMLPIGWSKPDTEVTYTNITDTIAALGEVDI